MKKSLLFFLILLVVVAFLVPEASAQCAMCRAAVESNIENGSSSVGGGLNTGILYLMAVPYIIFTVIGVAWYRASRANKAKKSVLA